VEGRDRRISGQGQPRQKCKTLSQKQNQSKKDWRCLPTKQEALSSNSSTQKRESSPGHGRRVREKCYSRVWSSDNYKDDRARNRGEEEA
jgi:hypothetical protein